MLNIFGLYHHWTKGEARSQRREERGERREERGQRTDRLDTSQKPHLSSLSSVFSLLKIQ